MTNRIAVASVALALVLALSLTSCSSDCITEACDATKRAQSAGDIDQGITGVIAYRTDACENGCCECSFASVRLLVHAVDAPITSTSELEGRTPNITSLAEERYSLQLTPGHYAVCTDQQGSPCANVEITAGEVLTVNVQTLYGPTQLEVFDAGGTEQPDSIVD